MTSQESSMTPEQSMQVINQMISNAKQSFSKVSFYFLLWGVLFIFAGIAEFVLGQVIGWQHPWIGWPIAGTIGGVVASIKGARDGKKAGASTYMDRVFAFLWGAFTFTLVLIIVGSVHLHTDPGPFIMIMTGLPTFVSGGLMRFKPLVIGGMVFWTLGILSFFFFDGYESLVFAVALLCGYIIPGLMLKRVEDAV